jgi:DNA-directed RNA polymerase subunit RPC12/RpoP
MPNIFICPDCQKPFESKKAMQQHRGGAHLRDKEGPYACKDCHAELIAEGIHKNWPDWAIKQRDLICRECKTKRLRASNAKRQRDAKLLKARAGLTVTPTKKGGLF